MPLPSLTKITDATSEIAIFGKFSAKFQSHCKIFRAYGAIVNRIAKIFRAYGAFMCNGQMVG